MSKNYFFTEVQVSNTEFPSKSTIELPNTMTHIMIVHDGDTDSNTHIEWSFGGTEEKPLDGILKPRCDGPWVADGINVSKIWLRKKGDTNPNVRVWAWRRGGG